LSHGPTARGETLTASTPPAARVFRTALMNPVTVWEAAGMWGAAVVLAHQGGWDEILLVAVPIAVFVGLLWLANARAARHDQDR